jgi:excisionase family DNA binding protein
MAQLSISEAAKLVARDRKTLYRLIKEGRLSATQDATGARQVETSELLRVFGEIKQPETLSETPRDSRATVSMRQHETVNETVRVALLEAELRHARDMLAEKATLLAAKESQIDDLRHSLRLLEAPRSQAAPDPAPKGFWTKPRKLFGW